MGEVGAAETERERMRQDVAAGLARSPRELSPKYFYDRRGSELFERITTLPEYYPTRAERALLDQHMPDWIAALRPATLVELGAGAADKSRILLDAMDAALPRATYVPIDISADFLESAAEALRDDYDTIRVEPVAADISMSLRVPAALERPALFALLGGTIGNFRMAGAVGLLRRVRAEMEAPDRFLLGLDLEKETRVLEAAYNDRAGVTAEFNLNVLRVLNRELGADFPVEDFRHRAFYNRSENRIEMHLVATRAMTVRIPAAGSFELAAGESIRTEISCKYSRERAEELLRQAGLRLERWFAGPGDPLEFALAVAAPA